MKTKANVNFFLFAFTELGIFLGLIGTGIAYLYFGVNDIELAIVDEQKFFAAFLALIFALIVLLFPTNHFRKLRQALLVQDNLLDLAKGMKEEKIEAAYEDNLPSYWELFLPLCRANMLVYTGFFLAALSLAFFACIPLLTNEDILLSACLFVCAALCLAMFFFLLFSQPYVYKQQTIFYSYASSYLQADFTSLKQSTTMGQKLTVYIPYKALGKIRKGKGYLLIKGPVLLGRKVKMLDFLFFSQNNQSEIERRHNDHADHLL